MQMSKIGRGHRIRARANKRSPLHSFASIRPLATCALVSLSKSALRADDHCQWLRSFVRPFVGSVIGAQVSGGPDSHAYEVWLIIGRGVQTQASDPHTSAASHSACILFGMDPSRAKSTKFFRLMRVHSSRLLRSAMDEEEP